MKRRELGELAIGDYFIFVKYGPKYRIDRYCHIQDLVFVTGGNVLYLTFRPEKIVIPVRFKPIKRKYGKAKRLKDRGDVSFFTGREREGFQKHRYQKFKGVD